MTRALPGWLQRVLAVAVGLLLFVLALELLKKGAFGLGPLLRSVGVAGFTGGLGFGWLMACVVLSGSPVAAMALSLLASAAPQHGAGGEPHLVHVAGQPERGAQRPARRR